MYCSPWPGSFFEAYYPHHAELGRIPNTNYFRNIRRFANLQILPGVLIYRFDASLFFANANNFREVLLDYKSHREDKLHTIIVDMESINSIDSTAIKTLEQITDELKLENIQLFVTEVKGPVRDKLYKSGLFTKVGENHFFVTNEDAINYLDGTQNLSHAHFALQTNITKQRP